MLYRIGDFSQKTGIPVKTLRYYDEINLFKPSYTERFSGYRYYEINQIKDIKLISKLKGLDLSLEEIKQFLETKDIKIILNKRKTFEEKLERIEEFMNVKEDAPIYNIEEGDYRKYIEIKDSSRILNLIKTAFRTLEKMRVSLDNIDLEERDPVNNKPI